MMLLLLLPVTLCCCEEVAARVQIVLRVQDQEDQPFLA